MIIVQWLFDDADRVLTEVQRKFSHKVMDDAPIALQVAILLKDKNLVSVVQLNCHFYL